MTTAKVIAINPLATVTLRVVFPRGMRMRLWLGAQIIRVAAFVAGVDAKVEFEGSELRA